MYELLTVLALMVGPTIAWLIIANLLDRMVTHEWSWKS